MYVCMPQDLESQGNQTTFHSSTLHGPTQNLEPIAGAEATAQAPLQFDPNSASPEGGPRQPQISKTVVVESRNPAPKKAANLKKPEEFLRLEASVPSLAAWSEIGAWGFRCFVWCYYKWHMGSPVCYAMATILQRRGSRIHRNTGTISSSTSCSSCVSILCRGTDACLAAVWITPTPYTVTDCANNGCCAYRQILLSSRLFTTGCLYHWVFFRGNGMARSLTRHYSTSF